MTNNISKLNDDCLSLVFSYFTHKEKCMLELVCWRWKSCMFKYQNVLRLEELCVEDKDGERIVWKINVQTLTSILNKCLFIEEIHVSKKMLNQIERDNYCCVLETLGQ